MNKLKIGACVVLYNPDSEAFENIKRYGACVDKVVMVDNSDNEIAIPDSALEKYHYINMHGNKGIAAALNAGMKYLYENGFEVGLTMDQDSKFPTKDYDKIHEIVEKHIGEYALIGLNYCDHYQVSDTDITEVKTIITSGNFVRLEDFMAVDGFFAPLFIDYVDFDFNFRLHRAGKKIAVISRYSLIQTIGNPIAVKLFFSKRPRHALNHSPIRYYYRYRNSCYLTFKYGLFFLPKFLLEIFKFMPVMLIFEPRKREKMKMIMRGLNDGIHKRLGAYSEHRKKA